MDLKSISSDLKSINLESVKAKIKSIDKKILIKFGIGFLSVIIFLIIYYAVLSPIVEKKKAQLDNMQKKQAEITKMNQEIKASKAKIKKLTQEKEKKRLFRILRQRYSFQTIFQAHDTLQFFHHLKLFEEKFLRSETFQKNRLSYNLYQAYKSLDYI